MKKAILLLLVSPLVLTACGNSKNTSTNSNKTETIAKPTVEKYYFKNDEVKIHDLKIKITNFKIIPAGEQGNEYGKKTMLAIWYKTTNLSNKKIDPTSAWIAVFNAYQDDNKDRENKLNVGSLPDQKFLDSQTQEIKKNGTVENAISYELTDDHTPVILKATQGLDGKELGTKTIKIKDTSSSKQEESKIVVKSSDSEKAGSKSSSAKTEAASDDLKNLSLTDFINKYGMSPAAYKMEHEGMSEKEALNSTPDGMKSSGEKQSQYQINHPNAYKSDEQSNQTNSSSQGGMTPEEASRWEEDEYKANEYQKSPSGQWYHFDRDGSSQKIDTPPADK